MMATRAPCSDDNATPTHHQDGSDAALPHWAKWSEAYVADATEKLQRAFASRLPLLKSVATKWDPNGMFVNKFFARLFVSPGYGMDS